MHTPDAFVILRYRLYFMGSPSMVKSKKAQKNGSVHVDASMVIGDRLLIDISQVIEQARTQIKRTVNHAMVQTYWHIGRLIVEHEQQGESRATYGMQQLQYLSERLGQKFGKGFDVTNLRNMRRFYQAFPIRETVSLELSWSHYNVLARIENLTARNWYLSETVEHNWSVRALERQVSVLYYERLLSSQEKVRVRQEALEKTKALTEMNAEMDTKHYLRDPYVLDFLNISAQQSLETNLEQGIIDNLKQFLLELGKGFAFVARQQRISTGDQDFYIDLVFYNFKLKCFLLIDLKLGKELITNCPPLKSKLS